jgi:hypothetical protein
LWYGIGADTSSANIYPLIFQDKQSFAITRFSWIFTLLQRRFRGRSASFAALYPRMAVKSTNKSTAKKRTLKFIDKCRLSIYNLHMIRRFQHRGLKRLYEDDDRGGINAGHVEKARRIPERLKSSLRP